MKTEIDTEDFHDDALIQKESGYCEINKLPLCENTIALLDHHQNIKGWEGFNGDKRPMYRIDGEGWTFTILNKD